MKMLISHHHHYQQMKNPQSPVRHQSQVHENYYQSRTSVPDVPDTLPTFKHSFTFNGLGYFESSDAVDTKSSQIFGFIIGFINCDEKWATSVAYRRCSYLRMTCISLWWVTRENTASHVYRVSILWHSTSVDNLHWEHLWTTPHEGWNKGDVKIRIVDCTERETSVN